MEDKDIKSHIKKEVEKYVIKKCSTELEDGELLLVNLEVGEMPKEEVVKILMHLKELFADQGITKAIFVPTVNGEGTVNVTKIKENKTDGKLTR